MDILEKREAIKIMGRPKVIEGYAFGLHYPALVMHLSVHSGYGAAWLSRIDDAFGRALEKETGEHVEGQLSVGQTDQAEVLYSLLYWMNRLQQSAGLSVFEQGKIIGVDPKTDAALIALPTPSSAHKVTGQVMFWLVNVFNSMAFGRDVQELLKEMPNVVHSLAHAVSCSYLRSGFLITAFQLGIPCFEIASQLYQFGYGVRSRLLDYTFTDQTSQIGARLARDKRQAGDVLRKAGIPVPQNRAVSDLPGAEKAAYELGFPVVVKPADKDGGIGVAAGLSTIEEVREAFLLAQELSNNILVEKHAEGRDYRLTVFQGELVWAVERIPGGVTGDGSSSVEALLDRLNEEPLRGENPLSLLKRIALNDEALALLSKAGLNVNSIPREGVFVRLRRIANVNCGGMPVTVTGMVHPDNRLLAIRAASAMRLDLAGVDLLIPDISHSWRESGAVVCEVNAQPGVDLAESTLSPLYTQILRTLVQGNGRIPVAILIGAFPEWNMAAVIADRLREAGFSTGRSDHEGVWIGMAGITAGVPDPYTAGLMLAGDKGVDAIVLCINDTSVLRTGLPFERFDLLVLAGSHITRFSEEKGHSKESLLRTLFVALSPCCDGKVIVVDESGIDVRPPLASSTAELLNHSLPKNQAAAAIADMLIEMDRKHRSEQSAA
jgi:cyanophycin synthetase